ncbi:hypothetical protein C7G42_16120 [Bradyrhizobium sp. MOS003]|nr:hypothetical protein C7G42_16120 [Bradyrhizobium sp. MOS003]
MSCSQTSRRTPSLRAQRSNPGCRRGKTLDCFAALAMTSFMAAGSPCRARSRRRRYTPPWRAPADRSRSR